MPAFGAVIPSAAQKRYAENKRGCKTTLKRAFAHKCEQVPRFSVVFTASFSVKVVFYSPFPLVSLRQSNRPTEFHFHNSPNFPAEWNNL